MSKNLRLTFCAVILICGQLIHAQSAEQRPELVAQTGHVFPVWQLAISDDNRLLVSASLTEGSVVLWDIEHERQLRTFNVESGAGASFLSGVRSLALSSNGRTLAVGADSGVTVFNVEDGKERYHFLSNAQGLTASVGTIALCFSATGGLLAALDGGSIQIWNMDTGNLVRSFPQTGLTIAGDLVFFPDERHLAATVSGQAGGVVRVLDISSGNVQEHQSGAPLNFSTRTLAYSPDGRLIALAKSRSLHRTIVRNRPEEQELTVSDVLSGTEKSLLKTEGPTFAATLSSNGALVGVSEGTKVRIVEAKSSREINSINVPNTSAFPFPYLAVAFTADQKLIATGAPDGKIMLWDVSTAQLRKVLQGHANFASTAAFSEDGGRLFTGARTQWDLGSGIGQRATPAQSTSQLAVVSGNGHVLAAINLNDSAIQIWDLAHQTLTQTVHGPPDTLSNKVALSPDGSTMAVSYRPDFQDPAARSRNEAAVRRQIAQVSGAKREDMNAAMQSMLAGNPAFEIKLWNTHTGAELATLQGNTDGVGAISFAADGRSLVSVNKDEVRLWEVPSGKLLSSYPTGPPAPQSPMSIFTSPAGLSQTYVNAVAVSPDGQAVVVAEKKMVTQVDSSAIADAMAQIANSRQSRPKRSRFGGLNPLPQFGKKPEPLARPGFDPTKGGMHIEGPLEVFSMRDGHLIGALPGHASGAESVAFSPDGKLLASGGDDHVIRLWSVSEGRLLREFVGENSGINSLSFSPDGKLLASSANGGSSRIWEVESGEQLATLFSLNDGADWLVVSPEGLFDGSPSAWHEIIWRYGGNTFNVYPVEIFFNEFFYPGLLADIYAGKRPKPAVEISRVDRRQPEVKLTAEAPPANGRVATVRLYVAQAAPTAQNSKGSGAKELRLFRNGSLVKAWHGDLLQGRPDVRFTASVPVIAGENRFTAYAFNDGNVKSADASAVVQGAETLRRSPTTYVLAIGVNKYADPDYNLRFAADDAQSFAETIRQRQTTLATPTSVEVTTLIDDQATRANILNAIAQIAHKVSPEDHVLIFFASHGTAAKSRFYILPHDLGYSGSRDQLDEQAVRNILTHSISDLDLQRAFEPMDAADVVVVIDACNSGQALEAEEKRRGPMNSKGLAQLAYEKGMYILTASQSYQAALEASQLGHGLLTYSLVQEGLAKNEADDDPKDGKITVREWLDYGTKRVPEVQDEKLQQARELRRALSFGDTGKAQNGKSQVPKVFYRRETEASPWVVAETSPAR